MALHRDQLLFPSQKTLLKAPHANSSKEAQLYEKTRYQAFEEVYLKRGEVTIVPKGIFFDRLQLLQSSLPEYLQLYPRHGLKTKAIAHLENLLYYLKGTPKINEKAIWVTDLWCDSYYHWLIEACPRLLSIRQHWSDATLYLPQNLTRFPFVKDSLEVLGVPHYKFLDQAYRFTNLLVPMLQAPTGRCHPQGILSLREAFKPSNSSPSPERIFISRSKAQKRKIVDEEKLYPILKKHQFEIHHMEDYTLKEQIHLMQNCQILIGPHGAGLTNMLFMPENGQVLELKQQENVSPFTLYHLAASLGHNYQHLYGRAKNPENSFHLDDFHISKTDFEEQVQNLTSDKR